MYGTFTNLKGFDGFQFQINKKNGENINDFCPDAPLNL